MANRREKDFLTPALHRRFMEAAAFLWFLCYAEAIALGEWNHCTSPPNHIFGTF